MTRILFWMLALLGHSGICVALSNRIHAIDVPRWFIHLVDRVLYGWMFVFGLSYMWDWTGFQPQLPIALAIPESPLVVGLLGFCALAGAWLTLIWIMRTIGSRPPANLVAEKAETIDVAHQIGSRPVAGFWGTVLDRVPGNQMLHLQIQTKTVADHRIDHRLHGLRIVHLSDLHYTGKITREYFDYVIDRANSLEGDLVFVTGDLVDRPSCLSWFRETFGRLRSRHGVFFVLGNHDKRLKDQTSLQAALSETGMIHLGRRSEVLEIDGYRLLLAGNELPWYGPPPTVPDEEVDLRILLTHSPDQFGWARKQGFDLVFAGHTHGGQIRLPGIGPIVAPSLVGVKYASGFFEHSGHLMQVSRGLSGKNPIRLNCPPELAQIVLESADAQSNLQPQVASTVEVSGP